MTTIQLLMVYGSMISVLILGDLLWLGVLMKDFYHTHLNHILGPVHWISAILFYILYTFGVFYFAVAPTLTSPMSKVVILGALLGLVAYGTYDLTNMATLREWPMSVTIVDIAWGIFLTSVIACTGHAVAKLFL